MSACDGCIKYLLFFFNLIFSLSGLALIIIGAFFLSNTSNFSDLSDSGPLSDISSGLRTPQILIIIIGVVIFFIATLGCCGAIRENRCMLITFAILLLSIFIVQLAIGIFALTHNSDFKEPIEKGLEQEFSKIPSDPKVQKFFDVIQKDLECCGVKGFSDYLRLPRLVPGSCCQDKSDCKIRPAFYWNTGCAEAIASFTGKAGRVLGGVTIVLSVTEVLGAIFALRLASKFR